MTRQLPDLFRRLVQQHHGAVYRSAMRVVADEATARDVTQDVFVRALRGKVRFDEERDEVATLCWLAARLAQNALRARRRRRSHEENAMHRSSPSRIEDPAAVAAANDLHDVLQRSVTELPDELRVPLQLHCQDDWTLQAIGSSLRLSTSTVHDRVQRAIERLRARLSGKGFALAGGALPAALRELPPPPVPGGLEAQLLAAGKASAAVAGVEVLRRVAVLAALVVGVATVAVAANAWAADDGPVAVERAASAGVEQEPRRQRPTPEAAPPIERARILPGDDAGRELRAALERLPGPPQARFETLRGTVHDADAWPVVGAVVEVVAAGGLKAFDLGHARTDHNGAFSVEFDVGSLHPRAVCVQVVEDTTTLLVTPELSLPRTDPKAPLELVLPASAGVATDRYEWDLFAHDEAGLALAGVTVSTRPAPLPEPGRVGGFVDARAETDARGHAVLRGRRLGDKWLFVDGREIGRGYTFTKVALDRGGAHERSVLVPEGRSLNVHVERLDEGSLRWVTVWLRDEQLGVSLYAQRDDARDGEVTFTGLGDGPYSVYSACSGSSRSVQRGVVAQGQTVELRMKPLLDERDVGDHMAEVHGSVFDAETGEELAIESWRVDVYRARAGESTFACDRLVPPSPRQTAVSMDKSTGFHEGGLEPGRHAVVAMVPGYAVAVHELEVSGSELFTDVRIELHRGGALRGRLVDGAGRPVPRRGVRVIGVGAFADERLDAWRTHVAGGRTWRVPPTWPCAGDTTDENGEFEVLGVPPRVALRLFAQCAGGGVGVLPVAAIDAGEVREGLELRVTR